MYFLDMVKVRKKDLDKTIQEIANDSGVSIRTINRFLSGENIGYKYVESILSALHLNLGIDLNNQKIA